MSIVNVRFRSEALGKHTSFNVIHPDTGTGPYPVLLWKRADRLVGEANAPRVSCDCGIDDDLLTYNRELNAYLTRIELDHHLAEHPGAHIWDYWDEQGREALAQHAEVCGLVSDRERQ